MKDEILAAVNFLTRLVGKNEDLSSDQVKVFQNSLGTILMEKFEGHWFPEKPCKGQAYRCIRVNGNERRDPVLEQAAEMCGLQYENLKLPVELTVWVDPLEVCCRWVDVLKVYLFNYFICKSFVLSKIIYIVKFLVF